MKNTLVFLFSLLICGSLQAEIPGHFHIKNFDALARYMQLNYRRATEVKKIKVAILDSGFEGYEDALGVSIHHETKYFNGAAPNRLEASSHGTAMAQILYAFTTNQGRYPDLAPEVYLLESGGYDNFRGAIDKSIELKVDYILYASVFDHGTNYDGKGFWNAEVDRALAAGIKWVNAAGNKRRSTVNLANFKTNDQKQVIMPGPDGTIPVTCIPTAGLDHCPLMLVLSWNDNSADPRGGTDKDLDLQLQTKQGNSFVNLETSRKVQIKEGKVKTGQTKYPREIIETKLSLGLYYVRVFNRSANFNGKDQLRLMGFGQGIQMSYMDFEENLFPPADHPGVITIGALDSDLSSQSKSLGKPNHLAPHTIDLGFGNVRSGSSNAAAIWLAHQIHLSQYK